MVLKEFLQLTSSLKASLKLLIIFVVTHCLRAVEIECTQMLPLINIDLYPASLVISLAIGTKHIV